MGEIVQKYCTLNALATLPGFGACMKKLHSRHVAHAAYCCWCCLFAVGVIVGPPLVFAAEVGSEAATRGSASSVLFGLAALAGAALGACVGWLCRRRSARDANAQQPAASYASNPEDLNAANTLTAGFIHEFNNTLCTIQGFTDLAILRSSGQGLERQGLEQIRIGAQRSTRLLEQLERFHMEAGTTQPVPLGLLLKGYGKWLQTVQAGPAEAEGAVTQREIPARLAVQVRDTAYMVLAQPVQVQRMLALLHQAVMAAAGSSEGKQVQLVLRQTVIDRVGEQNTRLELVLQGITALPAASTGELEQLTADLGGSLTMQEEQDGSKSCCLALPGLSASASQL